MLLVRAKVGISRIHGLGLIAQEFIPKGTVVWRLVPGFDLLLTEEEVSKLPVATQDYIRWHGHFDSKLKKHVLAFDDDRFTNHSDQANISFLGDHAVANRNIQPGEEMTDNYDDYGKSIDFRQTTKVA